MSVGSDEALPRVQFVRQYAGLILETSVVKITTWHPTPRWHQRHPSPETEAAGMDSTRMKLAATCQSL
eukprot:364000-Chlamydomonas_euryale.AAC.2